MKKIVWCLACITVFCVLNSCLSLGILNLKTIDKNTPIQVGGFNTWLPSRIKYSDINANLDLLVTNLKKEIANMSDTVREKTDGRVVLDLAKLDSDFALNPTIKVTQANVVVTNDSGRTTSDTTTPYEVQWYAKNLDEIRSVIDYTVSSDWQVTLKRIVISKVDNKTGKIYMKIINL